MTLSPDHPEGNPYTPQVEPDPKPLREPELPPQPRIEPPDPGGIPQPPKIDPQPVEPPRRDPDPPHEPGMPVPHVDDPPPDANPIGPVKVR